MDVDAYVARREQRRKTQLWVHVGVVVLIGASQVARGDSQGLGLILVGYVLVMCPLILYFRMRPEPATPTCRAQVPVWA